MGHCGPRRPWGLTAVVAAGLAGLAAGSPSVLTASTVLGAGYLLWLGATTAARPATPQAATQGAEQDGSWTGRALRAGISGLNPKALLLFLALPPQFATRGAYPAGGRASDEPVFGCCDDRDRAASAADRLPR